MIFNRTDCRRRQISPVFNPAALQLNVSISASMSPKSAHMENINPEENLRFVARRNWFDCVDRYAPALRNFNRRICLTHENPPGTDFSENLSAPSHPRCLYNTLISETVNENKNQISNALVSEKLVSREWSGLRKESSYNSSPAKEQAASINTDTACQSHSIRRSRN